MVMMVTCYEYLMIMNVNKLPLMFMAFQQGTWDQVTIFKYPARSAEFSFVNHYRLGRWWESAAQKMTEIGWCILFVSKHVQKHSFCFRLCPKAIHWWTLCGSKTRNEWNEFLGHSETNTAGYSRAAEARFCFFPFTQVFGHWWGKLCDKHGAPHVWKHTFIVSVYCILYTDETWWNKSFYINSTHGWSYPDSACPFWDYDVCPWSDHMMPCATCSGKAYPRKPLGTWTLQIGVTNYASCKPALWNLLQDQWGNRSRIEDVYIYMIIYVSV